MEYPSALLWTKREDWSSENGYWLEDSLDTKQVISITIFIQALLDDDLFEKYAW